MTPVFPTPSALLQPPPPKKALHALHQQLQRQLPASTLIEAISERLAYECDACVLYKAVPGLVVSVQSEQQVQTVIKACVQHGVPFVARGAGTGLSGGALCPEHGVVLAVNRLNKVLELNLEQRYAWVEVGVVNADLNRLLAPHGLQYAPDPSSQGACTLGGNIAENAGGIHCFKQGVTSDHILGLRGYTATGEAFAYGGATLQTVPLALQKLWLGSEGTLGVVTQACVHLTPKPAVAHVFLLAFARMEQAADCVSSIIQQGLQPAAMEYLDQPTVWAVNRTFGMGFPEGCQAILLVEVAGSPEQVAEESQQLEAVFTRYSPQTVKVATTPEACQKLWKVRKLAVGAYGQLSPAFYVHDCVIPRSRLKEVLQGMAAISEQTGIPIANVFHAADGNLHPNLLFNPHIPGKREEVIKAGDAVLELCLSVGGTLSGEHGIGIEKRGFMAKQFSPDDLLPMHQLKALYDPTGLANPEKLLPAKHYCGEGGLYHTVLSEANQQAVVQKWTDASITLQQGNETEPGFWI